MLIRIEYVGGEVGWDFIGKNWQNFIWEFQGKMNEW